MLTVKQTKIYPKDCILRCKTNKIMVAESYIKLDVNDNIGTVEFFTPNHNALPSNMLKHLSKAIEKASKDDTVKVIILKSGGDKTFCSGASFDELLNIENEEDGETFFSGFANVINAIRKSPKFVIGIVQGKAIGGGVGLIAACDYVYATKTAAIKLSELSIGIGPFVIGPVVERKIGTAFTYEMSIDATNFRTAEWAKEKGLYAALFDDADSLMEATNKLAITLSNYSAEAMAEVKKAFWTNTDHWDSLLYERAAISGRLVLTDFTKQTLKAFKNK